MNAPSTSFDAVLNQLENAVGADAVSVRGGDLDEHARDQSSHLGHRPDAVVWPRSTADVQAVMRIAQATDTPVTCWGAGTSLEGNPIAIRGGIVLDFRRMNRVIEIHEGDFQVTLEPGVLYKDLNKTLGKQGLFFAPDPGANASIGGMIANNAAGVRTVKYGATRDNVMGLEVVLASGDVVRTGSRAPKQSCGYDLTHLFVGAEGTLGIVTRATLKLAPLPEHFSAAIVAFPTVHDAAQTVFEVAANGLEPAAMELLDTYCVEIINRAERRGWEESPTLLMEFTGPSEAALHERMESVEEICRGNACRTFQSGVGREERERLWEMRHRFFETLVQSHPGCTWLISDICVPVSQFPALVEKAREVSEKRSIQGVINGHAGDGNIHTTYFFPPDDEVTREKVREANDELQRFALTLGGTSTGEHGVGLGKRKYMIAEHGEPAVNLMRALKATLDPQNLLNPGKIFPEIA